MREDHTPSNAERLAAKQAELKQVEDALVRNFEAPIGGRSRTKQFGKRVDAKLKRAAKLRDQYQQLSAEITALGGTVEQPSARPKPTPPVVQSPQPAPAPARPRDPRVMTDDELKTADERMKTERRAAGAHSISDEHRAVKAELGRRSAERTAKARRSAAAKKAAETRAQRKAEGLGPKRKPFSLNNEPPGGWTEADRVN